MAKFQGRIDTSRRPAPGGGVKSNFKPKMPVKPGKSSASKMDKEDEKEMAGRMKNMKNKMRGSCAIVLGIILTATVAHAATATQTCVGDTFGAGSHVCVAYYDTQSLKNGSPVGGCDYFGGDWIDYTAYRGKSHCETACPDGNGCTVSLSVTLPSGQRTCNATCTLPE